MFCPYCRNQIIDDIDICPNCGTNLKEIKNQIEQSINNQVEPNYQQPINNQKKNKKPLLLAIIIVIILIGISIFIATKLINKDTPKNNNTNYTDSNSTSNEAFFMPISDVFSESSGGATIAGIIKRGTIKLNDEIQIIGLNKTITTTVIEIKTRKGELEYASGEIFVALKLKNVSREDVEIGQAAIKPNSMKAASKFEADVYILTKEDGGYNHPFPGDYIPYYIFNLAFVIGTVTLPNNVETVNPGETSKMTIQLNQTVAMEVGTEFSIRNGGIAVGKGVVTKIYD